MTSQEGERSEVGVGSQVKVARIKKGGDIRPAKDVLKIWYQKRHKLETMALSPKTEHLVTFIMILIQTCPPRLEPLTHCFPFRLI